MDLKQLNDVEKHLGDIAPDVFLPKTMLAKGELAILYRLARDFVTPGNAIVDAGAFLGGSTFAFAAGLRDRADAAACTKTLFSFDQFLADESYLHDYLCDHFPEDYKYSNMPFRHGEARSFRHLYDLQVAPVQDYVTTVAGSLLDQDWAADKPIDVLFIDVAKTLDLNRFTLAKFFPAMIPGRSVLIQQDFHHIFHPYIHVTMEMLKDYFEIVVSGMAASRVYRLTRPIPAAKLQEVIDYRYDQPTVIAALEQVVEGSARMEKPLLRYLVPWMFHQWGNKAEAYARAAAITQALHADGYVIPPQAYQAFPEMERVD